MYKRQLHTIVYVVTLPLLALPRWISSVGMTLVIALINPIIPSATSKAAILVPIIKPIGEVLQLNPEMVVQAFQFGDGFTTVSYTHLDVYKRQIYNRWTEKEN